MTVRSFVNGTEVFSAPLRPCWYCTGLDDEGREYDPEIHKAWDCEACDERRDFRGRIATLESALRGLLDATRMPPRFTVYEGTAILNAAESAARAALKGDGG